MSVCTLVFGFDPGSRRPIVVAANRDEALDRRAEPPRVRDFGGPSEVLAPLDVKAGGTWIGVSKAGLFAALTNRFAPNPDPLRNTRGRLVIGALVHRSAELAMRWAQSLSPTDYNGFHLVVADRNFAFWVVGDGSSLRSGVWSSGIYVVTERSWDAAPSERISWLQNELKSWSVASMTKERCKLLLQKRADQGLEGVLVAVPGRNYGTRSSAIVELEEDAFRFTYTEGRPDRTPFMEARLAVSRFSSS